MAQSNLSLTFHDIRRIVGERRGYGVTVSEWEDNAECVSVVDYCLERGARMFYTQSAHDWSFFKPISLLEIPSGVSEIPLPGHFGYLMGRLYFTSDSDVCHTLKVENVGKVLRRRQENDETTGPPERAAIDERRPGADGQRKYLVFWPITDQAYTVKGQWSILADKLSTADPHPWGGAAHAETILQACLAASEQRDNEIGVQTALYKEALAASIEYDKKVKPQTLSDDEDRGVRVPHVTYTPA
jgi:hypothetical protein